MKKIIYVYNVAKYKTIREAAKHLFVTEPAISQQIRVFEKQLGFLVFKKEGRNITLTTEGKKLLPTMEKIINNYDDLQAQIHELANPESGQIRIGVGPMSVNEFLPRVYGSFYQLYPNVNLNDFVGGTTELTNLIIKNQLDIAVTSTNPNKRKELSKNGVHCDVLHQANYVAVVSDKHHLAKCESISIEDLSKERLILYDNSLAKEVLLSKFGNQIEKNILLSTTNNKTNHQLIKLGTAVSLLPEPMVQSLSMKGQEGLHFLNILGNDLTIDITCIYKSDSYRPLYIQAFIDIIINNGIYDMNNYLQ